MRYMGSKEKHAKYIVPILMDGHNEDKFYIEPFVGGGNLIYQVPCEKRWGNDTNKWSIGLLSALSRGWEPPDELPEEKYRAIKDNLQDYPPEIVGFAAFCCSYAGKEWGGYARGKNSKGEDRNFASEQKRNLSKQAKGLRGIKWTNLSYLELGIQPGSTVYCDPPYAGTTKYKSSFDHDLFWEWCSELVDKGCRVFVSEYSAPPNWLPVWEKEVTNSLTKDTGSKRGIERLYMRV